VARDYEPDVPRFAQHVEGRQVHDAGNAEDVIDPLPEETIDERLRASGLGANCTFGSQCKMKRL
jgi:hypothetical protein